MKKLEEVKIYNDLFWAAHSVGGFDNLFYNSDFLDKFVEWSDTDSYRKWKDTTEYQTYLKWQEHGR